MRAVRVGSMRMPVQRPPPVFPSLEELVEDAPSNETASRAAPEGELIEVHDDEGGTAPEVTSVEVSALEASALEAALLEENDAEDDLEARALAANAPTVEPGAVVVGREAETKRPSSRPPPSLRNSSLRPPPPSKRESLVPSSSSLFEDFDEGSLAQMFDALMTDGPAAPARDHMVDLTPVRELFAALAANHMRHVRDFMIDVKWGEAARDWIAVCVPAVSSLQRAAERLELNELVGTLGSFARDLENAAGVPGRTVEGESKERLLAGYAELVSVLPEAFALDRDKSQREAVIVQSLLLSIPDVRKVTIDKMHAAGLTSLSVLFGAKAEEIAVVADVPVPLAETIVARFAAYRREVAAASPNDGRAAERERLAELTKSLRDQHYGYEEAARGWSVDAKARKRELFRAREETWLAISVILARFGEVERLQGIERVPFGQRIALLTEVLEEAHEKYRLEPL